jgi:hypothetical protein
MPTPKERGAIRERLQAVEEDLLTAGKRHATIEGAHGVLEWFAVGAEREPLEQAEADNIQEIEEMIAAARPSSKFQSATKAGAFIWRPRS